jgi:hypothetical protein
VLSVAAANDGGNFNTEGTHLGALRFGIVELLGVPVDRVIAMRHADSMARESCAA